MWHSLLEGAVVQVAIGVDHPPQPIGKPPAPLRVGVIDQSLVIDGVWLGLGVPLRQFRKWLWSE